ncbi:MAG: methylthioribulose 1-phosphate dehydratase [Planctomycetota bacterium]
MTLSPENLPAATLIDPPLDQIDELRASGADFHRRGWSLGTSSNYSVVLGRDPLELLVTVSGKDKGKLSRDDFVSVGADGKPCDGSGKKSSAETMLHVVLAETLPNVGAVLHTHSVWATVLSDFVAEHLLLEGYEMLKGLDGNTTHETREAVRVFDNTQDIATLAEEVRDWLRVTAEEGEPTPHGFLLRKHGLYTWGATVADARRQVEVFEFLFECEAQHTLFAQSIRPHRMPEPTTTN